MVVSAQADTKGKTGRAAGRNNASCTKASFQICRRQQKEWASTARTERDEDQLPVSGQLAMDTRMHIPYTCTRIRMNLLHTHALSLFAFSVCLCPFSASRGVMHRDIADPRPLYPHSLWMRPLFRVAAAAGCLPPPPTTDFDWPSSALHTVWAERLPCLISSTIPF